MKRLLLTVGVFVGGIILTSLFFLSIQNDVSGSLNSKQHVPISLAGSSEITCTYPQVLSANFHEGKVNHELPPPETDPMIFTFTDLNSEIAKLKYIDATRMISETPLVKITDDEEKIVFIDGTGENYVSTHMIFKNEGTATYTKAVTLFGIPSGSLAMGTCVGI